VRREHGRRGPGQDLGLLAVTFPECARDLVEDFLARDVDDAEPDLRAGRDALREELHDARQELSSSAHAGEGRDAAVGVESEDGLDVEERAEERTPAADAPGGEEPVRDRTRGQREVRPRIAVGDGEDVDSVQFGSPPLHMVARRDQRATQCRAVQIGELHRTPRMYGRRTPLKSYAIGVPGGGRSSPSQPPGPGAARIGAYARPAGSPHVPTVKSTDQST